MTRRRFARRALCLLMACLASIASARGPVRAGEAPVASPEAPRTGAARRIIRVAADESLRPAMIALEAAYEADRPDQDLEIRYGPSGALRDEILKGAPTDLFLSAGDSEMAALIIAGRVTPGSSVVVATNRLMLVTGLRGRLRAFIELRETRIRQVGLGNPSTEPLGRFGMAALQQAGIWAEVKPKVRYLATSSAVAGAVERNEVDAGIVYASEALGNPNLRSVMGLDSWAQKVPCVAALVLDANGETPPGDFLDFLKTDAARQILKAQRLGPP